MMDLYNIVGGACIDYTLQSSFDEPNSPYRPIANLPPITRGMCRHAPQANYRQYRPVNCLYGTPVLCESAELGKHIWATNACHTNIKAIKHTVFLKQTYDACIQDRAMDRTNARKYIHLSPRTRTSTQARTHTQHMYINAYLGTPSVQFCRRTRHTKSHGREFFDFQQLTSTHSNKWDFALYALVTHSRILYTL